MKHIALIFAIILSASSLADSNLNPNVSAEQTNKFRLEIGKISKNIEYRTPSSSDKGSYSIIELSDLGNNEYSALTNRIGKNREYTDFTSVTINCSNYTFKATASGYEEGAHDKPNKPLNSYNSDWAEIVEGSSKYDLVNFVCKHIEK